MLIRSFVLLVLGLAGLASAAAAGDVILLAPMEIRASPQPLVPPAYRKTPLPAYPAAARAERLEGLVVLAVLVGANGRVVDVSVASSWSRRLPRRRRARPPPDSSPWSSRRHGSSSRRATHPPA